MATGSGYSRLELLSNSIDSRSASGTALLELLSENSQGIAGAIAAGNSLLEFYEAVIIAESGITAAGSSLLEMIDSSVISQAGILASSSAFLEFTSPRTFAFDGATGSSLIDFAPGQCQGNAGTSGIGASLLSFTETGYTGNIGTTGFGTAIIEISGNGEGYSIIAVLPSDAITLDTLTLPYVAFSMNVLTKGVTAYTDNQNNEVPWVIATPITDFGQRSKKYIHDLYVHMRSSGDVDVSLISGENKARQSIQTIQYNGDAGLKQRRAKLPKGISSTNWQFYFEGKDGADIELTTIEPVPVISQRTS